MPAGSDEIIREALMWCRNAQRSLAMSDEPRRESAELAMVAIHRAWQVEMKIGAGIRLERAAPLLGRHGNNTISAKSGFYLDLIRKHPEMSNSRLAHHIFNPAPKSDDGLACFY